MLIMIIDHLICMMQFRLRARQINTQRCDFLSIGRFARLCLLQLFLLVLFLVLDVFSTFQFRAQVLAMLIVQLQRLQTHHG